MILHVNKKTLSALLAAGCLLGAPNRREFDHIGQFNFKVEIEGVTCGAFKNVEGLDSETEVIEYREGDLLVRKKPGRTKYSNIVLRQGTIGPELYAMKWFRLDPADNFERKSGAIVLMNDEGREVARYKFSEAWPCKWKGWTLDGKGGDVTVEEIELAVEKIERGS